MPAGGESALVQGGQWVESSPEETPAGKGLLANLPQQASWWGRPGGQTSLGGRWRMRIPSDRGDGRSWLNWLSRVLLKLDSAEMKTEGQSQGLAGRAQKSLRFGQGRVCRVDQGAVQGC